MPIPFDIRPHSGYNIPDECCGLHSQVAQGRADRAENARVFQYVKETVLGAEEGPAGEEAAETA